MLKLGVLGTSRKENERRMPIHAAHFARIPDQVRRQLVFEQGYGSSFEMSDEEVASQTGGVAAREELLAELDAVVLLKPMVEDLEGLREGGTLIGWTHCEQQTAFTQVAIDRRQTLVALEEMFVWGPGGVAGRHTFYKNNELAGYCAVLHALQLKGIDGHYGRQRSAIIVSFGAVSRGAIYALKARGFRDITICIQRPDHEVREEVLDCRYVRIRRGEGAEARMLAVEHDGTERPFIELLSRADIIVNGLCQQRDDPLMIVSDAEIPNLNPGCLIIDVSCDEGMGFPFATPTTFDEPMLRIGRLDYYSVDHTPSYLWESATRSVSAALIVHLPALLQGREDGWARSETVRRAMVLEEGVVLKEEILTFQKRSTRYPHTPHEGTH